MMNLHNLILMAPTEGGSALPTFIFMGAIFLVMYFFMIRPQTKKAKDQRNFLEQVKKGDDVVTVGGIHGKVAKVNDDTFVIEVDANTRLKVEKSVISLDFTKTANQRTSRPQDKAEVRN